MIDLERFNTSLQKTHTVVDFPITNLDMSKYVVGYNASNYVYDLYGVCNHSGSTMGGHYTACVKVKNGEWHHFNDTHVSKISDPTKMIGPQAYCLFYRKRS